MSQTPNTPQTPPPDVAPGTAPDADFDAANRSLADALRTSFLILRLVMIVLTVLFLLSGYYTINEGEVGVRVRYGHIVGEPGKQVIGPSAGFSLPAPIEEIIRVNTREDLLTIDKAFWVEIKAGDDRKDVDQLPLTDSVDPLKDGSLITADGAIMHAKWQVAWQVDSKRAVDFIRNVGTLDDGRRLVRVATEAAIVRVAAGTRADDLFVRAESLNRNLATARDQVQAQLDALPAGISVVRISLASNAIPPLKSLPAFRAVQEAESERARTVEDARKSANQRLAGVAGGAYRVISFAIEKYEQARELRDEPRTRLLDSVINDLLSGRKTVRQATAPWAAAEMDPRVLEELLALQSDELITGDVVRIISEADRTRLEIVQQARAEATRFLALLPYYRRSPDLVREKLWRDTRQAIMSAPGNETLWLPDDGGKSFWLLVTRDPRFRIPREEAVRSALQQPPR